VCQWLAQVGIATNRAVAWPYVPCHGNKYISIMAKLTAAADVGGTSRSSGESEPHRRSRKRDDPPDFFEITSEDDDPSSKDGGTWVWAEEPDAMTANLEYLPLPLRGNFLPFRSRLHHAKAYCFQDQVGKRTSESNKPSKSPALGLLGADCDSLWSLVFAMVFASICSL
jgi:hypothetical protein